ncbi:MAG: hypothetical protein KGJ13_01180 [Patescibacteria group bacterium]|nr:hypothetical protein [Patescibacteria group bacterium]
MSIDYAVIIEKFAERHYIKRFQKKYKGAWDATVRALMQEFRVFDALFEKSIAETITDRGSAKVCKTEFKISGTQESRHGSGNRCIVAIEKETRVVRVLLVYHKNDLGGENETAQWKQIIKENYPEYRELL